MYIHSTHIYMYMYAHVHATVYSQQLAMIFVLEYMRLNATDAMPSSGTLAKLTNSDKHLDVHSSLSEQYTNNDERRENEQNQADSDRGPGTYVPVTN